ncbi:hypothetical protein O7627_16820 [Solwaraspora sp. WMMD1047]|uniref:hypothetical protein n=1 Tax=Solwaraspora sp. WMMD1047 TaxID=3016102 RepID=UPI0024168828|nr:hypothetical protein [Solwaraspora sp. WMMD1047]MDG4830958.1 hypothetical protein [Solwaraspora sp. WMMD1047]
MDSSELTYRDDVREFAVEIIELVLPSGTGYTLRTYPDVDAVGTPGEAAFLTRDGKLLLFQSPAALARFLAGDAEHDLTGLPGWRDRATDLVPAALTEAPEPSVPVQTGARPTPAPDAAAEPEATAEPDADTSVDADAEPDADTGADAEPDPDAEPDAAGGSGTDGGVAAADPDDAPLDGVQRFEFDLVPTNLAGSPDQWIPELLLPARNLTAELAHALNLRRIQGALAEGQYLDRFDDALRAATGAGTFSLARRRLRGFESSRLATQWRQLIRWLEQAVRWQD